MMTYPISSLKCNKNTYEKNNAYGILFSCCEIWFFDCVRIWFFDFIRPPGKIKRSHKLRASSKTNFKASNKRSSKTNFKIKINKIGSIPKDTADSTS